MPLYEKHEVAKRESDGEAFDFLATIDGVSVTRSRYNFHTIFIDPDQIDEVVKTLLEAKHAINAQLKSS